MLDVDENIRITIEQLIMKLNEFKEKPIKEREF